MDFSYASNYAITFRAQLGKNIFKVLVDNTMYITVILCGPGSSVGIATDYGLDGPGSNPSGDEIFRTHPDRPWGPPSLL